MKKTKSKKWYKRYPAGVREDALDRMRLGVNVSELAEQLGVHRATLYIWKRQAAGGAAAPEEDGQAAAPMDARDHRIQELQAQVAGLQSELGRAELEKRFFEAALRRIEESRRKKEGSGETICSRRSATGRNRKAN